VLTSGAKSFVTSSEQNSNLGWTYCLS